MYQYLIEILVTTFDGGRQADNLRTGAYDSHQFKLAHFNL